MNCKTCKFYDPGYDGFCTKHPDAFLGNPGQTPKMACNGDDYKNKWWLNKIFNYGRN